MKNKRGKEEKEKITKEKLCVAYLSFDIIFAETVISLTYHSICGSTPSSRKF